MLKINSITKKVKLDYRVIVIAVIALIAVINTYYTWKTYLYVENTRDIVMLDSNDKVKSEHANLINNGFIREARIPSAVHACSYADVRFGLGVLAKYEINNNLVACNDILTYAGIEPKYTFFERSIEFFYRLTGKINE